MPLPNGRDFTTLSLLGLPTPNTPKERIIEKRKDFYRYFRATGARIWLYNHARVSGRKRVIEFLRDFRNIIEEWLHTQPESHAKEEEKQQLEKLQVFYWTYASINR